MKGGDLLTTIFLVVNTRLASLLVLVDNNVLLSKVGFVGYIKVTSRAKTTSPCRFFITH
jgi:hypothetical protein